MIVDLTTLTIAQFIKYIILRIFRVTHQLLINQPAFLWGTQKRLEQLCAAMHAFVHLNIADSADCRTSLVVEPYPSEKSWSSSVGMMIIPNMMGKMKAMFQTTNQQNIQEMGWNGKMIKIWSNLATIPPCGTQIDQHLWLVKAQILSHVPNGAANDCEWGYHGPLKWEAYLGTSFDPITLKQKHLFFAMWNTPCGILHYVPNY